MDGDYFHNSLAYDEQVVAEKLGIYDYSPKPSDDVNINLKLALMQEELANSKRQLSQLKRNAPKQTRENFVSGGCGCGSSEGFRNKPAQKPDIEESILDNKKLLLFLVIILAAFCIIQYISYKNENRELLDMMCMLMKHTASSAPSQTQNSTTSPAPSTPISVQAQIPPTQA